MIEKVKMSKRLVIVPL